MPAVVSFHRLGFGRDSHPTNELLQPLGPRTRPAAGECSRVVLPDASLLVTGFSQVQPGGSPSFPTTAGVAQPSYGGGASDAFLAKLAMLRLGVERFGAPSSACPESMTCGVTQQPIAGASFALTASGVPAGAVCVLGVAGGTPVAGVNLFGLDVYLDLAAPLILSSTIADLFGWCELAFDVPMGAQGILVSAQSFALDVAGCGAGASLASSNALQFAVQ